MRENQVSKVHKWTYPSQVDPQGSPWRLRLPPMGTLRLTAGCGAIFSLLPTQWQRPKNAVKGFNGRQRQMCAFDKGWLGSTSNNNSKATRNGVGSVPRVLTTTTKSSCNKCYKMSFA